MGSNRAINHIAKQLALLEVKKQMILDGLQLNWIPASEIDKSADKLSRTLEFILMAREALKKTIVRSNPSSKTATTE